MPGRTVLVDTSEYEQHCYCVQESHSARTDSKQYTLLTEVEKTTFHQGEKDTGIKCAEQIASINSCPAIPLRSTHCASNTHPEKGMYNEHKGETGTGCKSSDQQRHDPRNEQLERHRRTKNKRRIKLIAAENRDQHLDRHLQTVWFA